MNWLSLSTRDSSATSPPRAETGTKKGPTVTANINRISTARTIFFQRFMPSITLLLSARYRQTFSGSVSRLACFAGWGDRNTASIYRSAIDEQCHVQTCNPQLAGNECAEFSQMISDRDRR